MNELAATSTPSSGFNPTELIFIVLIVLVVWMLLIRPQQRRKRQAQQQQNTIQPGARVRTTAGMYATVVDVDGDDVILEVAPGIECRYMKRAIMDVVSPAETMDEPDADEAPADEVSEDYAAEEPSDLAGQDGTVNGATGPGADEDADEAAYEQATGTKKD